MNLLKYIDLKQKHATPEMSKSLSKKTSLSRSALQAYLNIAEADLKHSVFSLFFFDFGKWLSDQQGKNYTPGTVREILRTLRKYVRSAILEGLVPNIDSIPSAIERLDSEVWPDAKPDSKKAACINRQDLNVKASVSSMLRSIDAWSTKQKMGIGTRFSDRKEREEALENRCAAIYLFCLITCGIEVKDALAIKRDWDGPEIPDSVYVERFGTRLSLSPAAKRLVDIYNRGSECTAHLFSTLDNKKYRDNLDNAAKLIEDRIVKFLHRYRLPLFRTKCVFIDWLNYAIENGLPEAEAESLWRSRLDPAPAPLSAADAAHAAVGSGEGSLDESWYLLTLIPLSVRRDRFVKMLSASGIFGEDSEARRRIYVPEERFLDKEHGEYAVFSRYVFFRATPVQALFANVFSPYAYVLRDRAKRHFAQIQEAELVQLQVMLRDFPDAVPIADGQKWLEEHNAKIVKGCKAIIRSGSLTGKEAIVIDVKGKKSGRPTYFIEYIEGAMKFKTHLEGVELDIVPA